MACGKTVGQWLMVNVHKVSSCDLEYGTTPKYLAALGHRHRTTGKHPKRSNGTISSSPTASGAGPVITAHCNDIGAMNL